MLPYESHVYSQHGEDGIIDLLTKSINRPDHLFLEIGWGDGDGNMTLNLLEKGWTGTGVDVKEIAQSDFPGLRFIKTKVEPYNLKAIFDLMPRQFDFFSLDIDSFDFDVAQWMLEHGWRPRVACVEINAQFGPVVEASFPWVDPGVIKGKLYRKTGLFGCSINKYRALWHHHGYHDFGFDSSATNAFFYDPNELKNLDHHPRLSVTDLPHQDDGLMQDLIKQHPYWNLHLQLIYQQYIPR